MTVVLMCARRRRDVWRPATTRADELLGYLRAAGPAGLTSREMDRYMPRRSWEGALEVLENTPWLILRVERRDPRPPQHRRKWVRAVLTGELTPPDATGNAAGDTPPAPDPQPTLFDDGQAAA